MEDRFDPNPSSAEEVVTKAALAGALALLLTAAGSSAQAPTPDTRASVAVLYFTNSALVRHREYQPLSKGITDMLITELSASPAIQVVERDRLQSLLEEQNLSRTDRVDKESAVRLGKILGAHHLLMGGFVIDPREKMRLDLRAVDVETSQVVYVESVSGKAEDVLGLIEDLGKRVTSRLRLPPSRTKPRPAGARTSKSEQLKAVMFLSRALDEQDRGNLDGAAALYRQALDAYPEYDRARVLLASLDEPERPRN